MTEDSVSKWKEEIEAAKRIDDRVEVVCEHCESLGTIYAEQRNLDNTSVAQWRARKEWESYLETLVDRPLRENASKAFYEAYDRIRRPK